MIAVIIAISVPLAMTIAWLCHVAIDYKWDLKAWWHDSDGDI